MSRRFEIKFSLHKHEITVFEQWVHGRSILIRPYPSRRVNSLYLDSPDFVSAQDNLNGIAKRLKHRIRWYGDDMNPKRSKFEIKLKRGRLGEKEISVFPLRIEDYLALSDHEQTRVISEIEAVGRRQSSPLLSLPTLQIRYDREYFVGPYDIRMTIDTEIAYRDMRLPGSEWYPSDRTVVEFKFDPIWEEDASEIISSFPFYPNRNSKYVYGLSMVRHALYL